MAAANAISMDAAAAAVLPEPDGFFYNKEQRNKQTEKNSPEGFFFERNVFSLLLDLLAKSFVNVTVTVAHCGDVWLMSVPVTPIRSL